MRVSAERVLVIKDGPFNDAKSIVKFLSDPLRALACILDVDRLEPLESNLWKYHAKPQLVVGLSVTPTVLLSVKIVSEGVVIEVVEAFFHGLPLAKDVLGFNLYALCKPHDGGLSIHAKAHCDLTIPGSLMFKSPLRLALNQMLDRFAKRINKRLRRYMIEWLRSCA
mgnify:CR=1 FL=1